MEIKDSGYTRPRSNKTFRCSTQLSTEFILLINDKTPTNFVGFLTFISILGLPNCATLSFVGNSYCKINEACTIKYAYLIYTSFLHSTAINHYSNQTSYYDTRSLCKHGKLKSAILGVTFFCQASNVTLFPRKSIVAQEVR